MATRLKSVGWTQSPRARPPGPQKENALNRTDVPVKLGQIKVWQKGGPMGP